MFLLSCWFQFKLSLSCHIESLIWMKEEEQPSVDDLVRLSVSQQ